MALCTTPTRRLPGLLTAGGVLAATLCPGGAVSQDSGLLDEPRALTLFRAAEGYADMTPERYGTPASPLPDERGVYLLLRMFRNVCLGLESGASLADVLPDGFSVTDARQYDLGPDAEPGGRAIVLSSTGDIVLDEDMGHPAIRIEPRSNHLSCGATWRVPGEIPEDRMEGMAYFLESWVPYELALVRAARPEPDTPAQFSKLGEWDRPCGSAWCPVSVLHSLSSGDISLTTALNVATMPDITP